MNAKQLKNLIRAINRKDSREAFRHIFYDSNKSQFVATNGKVLYIVRENLPIANNLLIHIDSAKELLKTYKKDIPLEVLLSYNTPESLYLHYCNYNAVIPDIYQGEFQLTFEKIKEINDTKTETITISPPETNININFDTKSLKVAMNAGSRIKYSGHFSRYKVRTCEVYSDNERCILVSLQ